MRCPMRVPRPVSVAPADARGWVRGGGGSGFTLVEILIVVVILGILAAVVVPQFSSASMEAVRTSVERQLQSINHQIELYRVRNGQSFPTADADDPMGVGGTNGGWGILVSENYLRETPVNPYTGSFVLVEGGAADAIGLEASSETGWLFEQHGNRLDVFAAGFDAVSGLFNHEVPEG